MSNSSEANGQTTTPGKRPHSKILVDGGDPNETARIQQLIGFVDGQTTNPSLIAKNPEVMHLVESGHRLTEREEAAEYRKIVQAVSPLVGDAGVSIEVFADLNTTTDEMLNQGREINSWIPNAYIKYPCIAEGLKAAQRSVAGRHKGQHDAVAAAGGRGLRGDQRLACTRLRFAICGTAGRHRPKRSRSNHKSHTHVL